MASYAVFKPGTGVEKVVEAWTTRDDVTSAQRTAAEFIWRF